MCAREGFPGTVVLCSSPATLAPVEGIGTLTNRIVKGVEPLPVPPARRRSPPAG